MMYTCHKTSACVYDHYNGRSKFINTVTPHCSNCNTQVITLRVVATCDMRLASEPAVFKVGDFAAGDLGAGLAPGVYVSLLATLALQQVYLLAFAQLWKQHH